MAGGRARLTPRPCPQVPARRERAQSWCRIPSRSPCVAKAALLSAGRTCSGRRSLSLTAPHPGETPPPPPLLPPHRSPSWRRVGWSGCWSPCSSWCRGVRRGPWCSAAWCPTFPSTGTSAGRRTPRAFPPTSAWCCWSRTFCGYFFGKLVLPACCACPALKVLAWLLVVKL